MAVNVAGLNLGMILIAMNDQQRYRFRTDALSFALFIVAVRFVYGFTRRWSRNHAYDRVLNAVFRITPRPRV
jgi:hypothetical protein